MEFHYTDEKNVQIVLALLKANNIKKVVVSPGATNESIVGSMQYDSYFEMYSCVDERSAAYMACGMAVESGEIVVLSCTGATSSRNYLPGLTEAYYRHIPILAITSSMPTANIGHLYPQCTNRSTPPIDAVRASYCIESIKDAVDEWDRTVKVNEAIAELKRGGGGPVHINLITRGCNDYSINDLPTVKTIKRIRYNDSFPSLEKKNVLVFIGERFRWAEEDTKALDQFCNTYNTIALCDHTSGYKGKYRVLSSLVATQENPVDTSLYNCDVLIHIGGISGDYYTMSAIKANEVWRVDEDGEMRDKFRKLTYVFEMPIYEFFNKYSKADQLKDNNKLKAYENANRKLLSNMPNLPFSNAWLASRLSKDIPNNSVIHLGILNSLRSWNFFEVDKTIQTYCNVGGFGIDGIMSTMIGAALCNPTKLYYAVLGDLAFFYDLNSIGNRNVTPNIRILLVNNGRGVEFHTYKHAASKFGEDTDKYIAAFGHNGIKSPTLVKEMARSLGFEYITARSCEDYDIVANRFCTSHITDKPMIFEVFTEKVDDADVLRLIRQINASPKTRIKSRVLETAQSILGEKVMSKAKKFIRK
jgi:2-succinyl-5-enolpyruvyl-6-hydroxy-3-cyclohexene-1-carboxylate synthase